MVCGSEMCEKISTRLFLVAGPTCSGKTYFGSIALKLGFRVYELGHVMIALYQQSGCEIKFDEFVTATHKKESGTLCTSRIVLDRIAQANRTRNPAPHVTIGIRLPEQSAFFRKHFANVTTVAICCNPRIRFLRSLHRNRFDGVSTYSAFLAKDSTTFTRGLSEVMHEADCLIVNEESKRKFQKHARHILLEK